MAIRNQSWYNLNSSRDYPVDETASSLSDKSERVPSDIITDIRVRWPDALGDYAFLGSVAVTPGAVTATVLAAVDLARGLWLHSIRIWRHCRTVERIIF